MVRAFQLSAIWALMMRISSQSIVRTALTTLHAGHFFHRDSHNTLLSGDC